jgi:transcriptional regulator with XRE-family HTH domain
MLPNLKEDDESSAPSFRPDRLKQLRVEGGFSLETFAQKMGISASQVLRWESGENTPSGDYVALIAFALNVTSDYLLGLVEEKNIYYQMKPLSPSEWNFIRAIRSGRFADALKRLAELMAKAS